MVSGCVAGQIGCNTFEIGWGADTANRCLVDKIALVYVSSRTRHGRIDIAWRNHVYAYAMLSKFGNARLRRAFWMAAHVAIRQRDNSFRAKYERYIARDRDNADLKRKALTAITAKMARTVHAVIKTGSDYRPFFEGPIPSGRTSLSKCREGESATL